MNFNDYSQWFKIKDTDDECKEILNSNLSDELKIKLIAKLKNKYPEYIPYGYPYWQQPIYKNIDTEITCSTEKK